jgi:hypothetical protein
VTFRITARAYRRLAVAVLCAVALGLGASNAMADVNDAQRTAAEALFLEARKLMETGEYASACPKLADSQRLDPGTGTLLNLGLCYKMLGRTASAWSAFREAAASARAARQEKREQIAMEEANALEATLSKLVISVSAEAAAVGAAVKLDGSAVPRSMWEMPMPVDPGEHVVEASAAGKLPWNGKVVIGETVTETITVPALADAPPAAEAPEDQAGKPATPPPHQPTTAPLPPEATDHAPGLGGQRTAALVSGGIGVVGLVVGTVYASSAKSRFDDSEPDCSANDVCSVEGIEARDEASTRASVATVGFGVGLVGLATGAILWFTNPSREAERKPADGLQVGGFASGTRGGPWGISVRGAW